MVTMKTVIPISPPSPAWKLKFQRNGEQSLRLIRSFIFLGFSLLLFQIAESKQAAQTHPFIPHFKPSPPKSDNVKWNMVKLTQSWGYSQCLDFKGRQPSITCRNENQPSIWIIHGLWPTLEPTNGPNNCKNIGFNHTQLAPIRADLNKYWYEIDSKKCGEYFWSYEWKKHGTCAMESKLFDSELKYFTAALNLRKKYDIHSILKDNGVIPEAQAKVSGYPMAQITEAFQKSLGQQAAPIVTCLQINKENGTTTEREFFLLEVQLCFNIELEELVPCRPPPNNLPPKKKENFMFHLPCPAHCSVKYVDPNADL